MKTGIALLIAGCAFGLNAAAEPVTFDFNSYADGPLEGQKGWNVFNKVPDSSAFSVVDGVGKTDQAGDKALVLQSSNQALRLVAPEALSWMPGESWTMEFDFKVGIPPKELLSNKPVLTVFLGNGYLTQKARWAVRIEATTDGSWSLIGGLPDLQGVDGIPAETIVEKPTGSSVAVSDWFRFVIKTKKLEEPDSFESLVEIRTADGQVVATRTFSDTLKNSCTTAMWNLSRMSCGFSVPKTQLGLACIDNLEISSFIEPPIETAPAEVATAQNTRTPRLSWGSASPGE